MKTRTSDIYDSGLIVLCGALAVLISGCNLLGFLASEGPFETKKAPQFNLQAQQDRKILLWVETPRSLNISEDVRSKLLGAFKAYMIGPMKMKPSNVLTVSDANQGAVQDPQDIARSLGAGFVLLVQVDAFELDSLQVRDYVTGQLVTRALLLDAESSAVVWPKQPEGKMVHIGAEVETGGRDAAISRLISGAAQCTLRYLYPCDKLKFKNPDERVSTQEAFEIETY